MIPKDFYSNNRQKLQSSLKTGLAIFIAHTEMQRANDMAYPFEQEANFLWLTGVKAADWRLIIEPEASYLVMPQLDDVALIFNGEISAEEAKRVSGVDEVLSWSAYEKKLAELSMKYTEVWTGGDGSYADRLSFTPNPALKNLFQELSSYFSRVKDCRVQLADLRAIKQVSEIETMKQAVQATGGLFTALYAQLPSLDYEYEVEALFTYAFRRAGLDGHAYDPIVASGQNACTLHYGKNSAELPKNGLVLIDIGAKDNGYAADITRTYAIGTPSAREVAVHKAVETAHHKIIQLIYPGVKFADYQASVDEIMKDALQEVALLKDRSDEKTYRKYFPHAISHGLGLDVHESLGGFGEFKPGMVLTVEPGIYIPEEGIGVRIEDDILVTETGHKNLSADLPTAL